MKCRSPLTFLLASTLTLQITHTHTHTNTNTNIVINIDEHIHVFQFVVEVLHKSFRFILITTIPPPPPPLVALRPNAGHGLLILDHAQRHSTVGRTSLYEWLARRRDLYLTTLNTDIHAPGGIRTHIPSKRAAVDPRLIPRSHCIG